MLWEEDSGSMKTCTGCEVEAWTEQQQQLNINEVQIGLLDLNEWKQFSVKMSRESTMRFKFCYYYNYNHFMAP